MNPLQQKQLADAINHRLNTWNMLRDVAELVADNIPQANKVIGDTLGLLALLVPSCIHAVLQAQAKGGEPSTYAVAMDALARSILAESKDMLEQMAKDDPEMDYGDMEENSCQWVEEADVVEDIQTRIQEICRENSQESA